MDIHNVMIVVIAIISIIVISLTLFPTIIKVGMIVLVVIAVYELADPKQNFITQSMDNAFLIASKDDAKYLEPAGKNVDGVKKAFTPMSNADLQAAVNEEKTDLLSQDDVMAEYDNKSSIYPIFSFTKGMAWPDTEAVIPFAAKDFDDRSALKQKHTGNKNRDAIAGAVSATRNVFDRYIRGELDENEARVWYSSEANMSSDFFPAF